MEMVLYCRIDVTSYQLTVRVEPRKEIHLEVWRRLLASDVR